MANIMPTGTTTVGPPLYQKSGSVQVTLVSLLLGRLSRPQSQEEAGDGKRILSPVLSKLREKRSVGMRKVTDVQLMKKVDKGGWIGGGRGGGWKERIGAVRGGVVWGMPNTGHRIFTRPKRSSPTWGKGEGNGGWLTGRGDSLEMGNGGWLTGRGDILEMGEWRTDHRAG